MTTEQGSTFIDAIKESEIKSFAFRTMNTFSMYHDGVNSFIVAKGEDILNVRAPYAQASMPLKGNVMCIVSGWPEISEAFVAGSAEQIKKFVESFGITLDDDQVKILLKTDGINRDIITPDYNNFRKLTPEEVAELSEEDKAKYDKDLADYNERKEQGNSTFSSRNFVAQITV